MNAEPSLIVGLLTFLAVTLCAIDPHLTGSAMAQDAGSNRVVVADSHSYGNPQQVRVRHLDLDLTADFEARQLKGHVVLDFERQPGCPAGAPLELDIRALEIESVGLRKPVEGQSVPFTPARFQLSPADPILGSKLTIELSPEATQARIAYHTSPGASALQWLEPALTAGKQHPFLFTQSEAIHARSWIPLQDSPGVRITYAATIHVPPALKAVMAAESMPNPAQEQRGIYQFRMPQSIPSYLIALAVGDLAFQTLGPRTGVWAEPSVVAAAAYEFADAEAMMAAFEKEFGPYRWGRYDILVLPPSFPFGGMENPRLTFATPTVLAGDRSLVSLVAHELAHSWSGNLVSNATWRDFWLNEGFTTYLERRAIESLYGKDRADMEAVLGMAELRAELARVPEKDQILHIDLTGRDPDDGMTRIAYEKGALFVRTLERAFGRARFDAFLRAYFDGHQFQSITTSDFEAYLRGHLLAQDANAARTIDLEAWVHRPGLPPGLVAPVSQRLEAIDTAADGWQKGTLPTEKLGAQDWSTQEWLRFLERLPEKLPAERLAELDRSFRLTERGNAEIAHQWLLVAIRNQYAPADSRLEAYLKSIGRRKLVLPLYRALLATPSGLERARAIYAKARGGYHPITADSIDRLLQEPK